LRQSCADTATGLKATTRPKNSRSIVAPSLPA
jgi:hypothetical protein